MESTRMRRLGLSNDRDVPGQSSRRATIVVKDFGELDVLFRRRRPWHRCDRSRAGIRGEATTQRAYE